MRYLSLKLVITQDISSLSTEAEPVYQTSDLPVAYTSEGKNSDTLGLALELLPGPGLLQYWGEMVKS